MKRFFGYIRVSTARQGERGVSLVEQREAIERYAATHELALLEWIEERETAAKHGRPEFARMLRLLRRGKADGVIIHKVDRSARNFLDWGHLSDLADRGVEVHFANESVDLTTRGGRLSADIQAAVAVDYIRNLREEVRKGLYGRLKQGIYPLRAPLGYLDCGGGKLKALDPERAPFVREAFRRYASGRYSLQTLGEKLHGEGLTTSRGGTVSRTQLQRVLRKPFYMGLMRLDSTGELFQGRHEALVSKSLFDAVQAALDGKVHRCVERHEFRFRRMVRCGTCSRHLIAERQKGNVYYRCQVRSCPRTCVREEAIETSVQRELGRVHLEEQHLDHLRGVVRDIARSRERSASDVVAALQLQLQRVEARLKRLTDLYLDGEFGRVEFNERKAALLHERSRFVERLEADGDRRRDPTEIVLGYLELANVALLSYEMARDAEKRRILRSTTSNLTASGKEAYVELSFPFSALVKRGVVSQCGHFRDRPRTTSRARKREVSKCVPCRKWVEELCEKIGSDQSPAEEGSAVNYHDPRLSAGGMYSRMSRRKRDGLSFGQ